MVIIVIFLVGILVLGGLFLSGQWKRMVIRRTGERVMARVIQIRSWKDPVIQDYSILKSPIPLIMGEWYEVVAQWIDPRTGKEYVLTSGRRRGSPDCQKGDFLAAYISAKGSF